MLMLKSLSVLIVAASAAHALQSPAGASNLGERGLADEITKPVTGIIGNVPLLGGLLGGGGGGDPTKGKVKRGLDDVAPVPTPSESLPDTESALNDVAPDHNAATPDTDATGLPGVGDVLPQDAGLDPLIPGLHKRQDEDDVDSNGVLDAEADLVRRGYRKAGVKSKVKDPKPAKPATFVKKSKKHPKTADKEHDQERNKHNKEHKKHHPVA